MSKGVKITLIYIMTYKLHCQENILAIKYWEVKNISHCACSKYKAEKYC